VDADDVQSMSIYTAGIPAQYGRKMGGVIVVNTLENPQPGFHGQVALSGGSFDSAGSSAHGEYGWGANSLGFSASGSMTDQELASSVPFAPMKVFFRPPSVQFKRLVAPCGSA
jgi:hypothetical protein